MRLWLVLLLCFVVLTSAALARPMAIDLVDVPVARLVANARQQIARAPNDAHAHYILARTCAIAYRSTSTPAARATAGRGSRRTRAGWCGFPYSADGVEMIGGKTRNSYDWIVRSR